MGFIKKSVAGLTMMGLAAAGAGAAFHTFESNEIPEVILSPVDELPPRLPQGIETLVCAVDTVPCTRDNALGRWATKNQIMISLKDMTPAGKTMPDIAEAVIAKEDEHFWDHEGIDVKAAGRALLEDIKAGRAVEGASTITRQVVGLLYPRATDEQLRHGSAAENLAYKLSPEAAQQLHEGRLALALEQVFSKDQILEMYLNIAPFGRGTYGIEAAAKADFGVSAKDLTLQQALIEASKLSDPSASDVVDDANPTSPDPQKLDAEMQRLRTHYFQLIDSMEKQTKTISGIEKPKLTPEQAAELRNKPIELLPYRLYQEKDYHNAERIGAQYFVDLVLAQAAKVLGFEDPKQVANGYTIYTTLNTHEQGAMYSAIKNEPHIQGNDLQAAGVSVRQDGGIVAMVGGKNYDKSQVNLAAGKLGGGSGRDSGSSNKGYAYAEAIKRGLKMDDVVDVPDSVVIPRADAGADWEVHTSGCDELGRPPDCTMTNIEALAVSSNTRAAMFVRDFGIEPIADDMKALGVDLAGQPTPSLIIGSGEISPLGEATGYNGLILNKGKATPSFMITKITDREGKPVYEYQPAERRQVFDEFVAREVIKGLKAVLQIGTAKGALDPSLLSRAAGKTGTANNNSDLWFTGSFSDPGRYGGQTASFWVGYPDGKIHVAGVTSHDVAALWSRYINGIPKTDQSVGIDA